MKVTTKLHGFEELDRKLSKLPEAVEKRVATASSVGAMKSVKADFVQAAPLGPDKDPVRQHFSQRAAADWARIVGYGHGRDNIRVIPLKKNPKGVFGARIDTGKAFWLYWYELGNARQKGRPFMLPTANRVAGKIVDSLRTIMGPRIEKEAKKL